ARYGGYFLLDYSVTYLLSCFVLCCTCLMFDCVRKVVDSLVCHKLSKQISRDFVSFAGSVPMFPQPYVPTFLRAFSKLGLMFPTFLIFITKLGPMFLQFI